MGNVNLCTRCCWWGRWLRITSYNVCYTKLLRVEKECAAIAEVVVPANYNTIGQIVISGSEKGIDTAIERLSALGARRAMKLNVSGAFHSPLMEPARVALEAAIDATVRNNFV